MPPLPFDSEPAGRRRGEGWPRPPADFAPILATKDPVLLVGGQAVNLWALYYQDRTADLPPFVSRDADVLGDRETLSSLGKLVGARPQFFPQRPPSNEVGVVITKDANGSRDCPLPPFARSQRGSEGQSLALRESDASKTMIR
jgi:hypothetical protein